MIKSGIYQILNIVNGKSYVGSAIDIEKRWSIHRHDFRNNQNSRFLQNAWNKYGEDVWKWNVLEYVVNKEWLIEIEQYWIDFLETANKNFGYNICITAGSTLGLKRNLTTKHKINLNKFKIGNTICLGRKLSDEHKRKIGETGKGRKFTVESKIKMSESKMGVNNPFFGKKHSQETKDKLSKIAKINKTLTYFS